MSGRITATGKTRPEPVPARPRRRETLYNAIALAAILGEFGLVLAIYWSIERYWLATGVLASSEVAAERKWETPTLELRMVLSQFLREPNWAGKRQAILEPSRLDAQGPGYYLGRDPDEVRAADFVPYHLPGTRSVGNVHALRADRPGHRPVIALFKRVGSGWKLDWEMFTQTYDETLPRFIAEPSFTIRTLKANLVRSFGPAGSGSKAFLVELSDCVDPGQRIEIELPMATPLMKEVAAGLEQVRSRPATVEVSWIRLTPEGDCVPALQRLVCWGWRGVTGQPVPAAGAVEAPEFALPPSAPRDVPTRPAAGDPLAGSNGAAFTAAVAD